MWVFPLGAAVVSALFSALLVQRWRRSRGSHLAAWAVALAMFAVASGAAAVGMLAGWSAGSFRVYYLFGAILNVPALGLGTLYLLAPRPAARIALAAVVVASVAAAVAVATGPVYTAPLASSGIPSAARVIPDSVRTLSRYYSFAGSVAVIGGALWSAVRLTRRRDAAARRLAAANALIAGGTLVVAVASVFARYGRGSVFAVGLFAGVTIMFIGFLKTRSGQVR